MLTVLTPEEETDGYLLRLMEMTGGTVEGEKLEKIFRAFPTDRFS